MIDEEILRELTIPSETKQAFPPGPWTEEDDLVVLDRYGFTCVIIRAHRGHLNGYVVVPESHPWSTVSSELEIDDADIEVHGGVTFASRTDWSKGNMVVGFDCAHAFDMAPSDRIVLMDRSVPPALASAYRDMTYVRRNVICLADSARRAVPLFYKFEDNQVQELEQLHARLKKPITDAELLDEANRLKVVVAETPLLTEGQTAEHMLHISDREHLRHLVDGLIRELGTVRPSGPDTNHVEEELEAILLKLK